MTNDAAKADHNDDPTDRLPPTESTPQPDAFDGPKWRGAERGRWSGDHPGTGRVKVSRRKRRVLRRRRHAGLALLVLGGFVVLVGVYLLVTGLMARSALDHARSGIDALRTQLAHGDLTAARTTAHRIAADAADAHGLTEGPVWAAAAGLPGGGEPLATMRGIAGATDSLGQQVLPELVTATRLLDPQRLRGADGVIDLASIQALAPQLHEQATVIDRATTRLRRLPASTWLGGADDARQQVIARLDSLRTTLHSAQLAAQVAPPMLGVDGPRRYLVAFETEAELRGLGGLPGAFAIVRADHGVLAFERFESDTTLTGTDSGIRLGTDFDNLYLGADATSDYLDSNVSPHFPNAARIWTGMWERRTGQHLDGALAVDPTALQYLLAATGPARLPDGTAVNASNVVALTQQQVYGRFASTDQSARKAYQLQIARAVATRLVARGDTTALLRAAGRAAAERRLLLWSATPELETQLAGTAVGGTIADDAAPFTGLAVNNAGGNKLDYYLHVGMDWHRTSCGPNGDVTVTIKATNDAPATLPAYVTGTTGRPGYPTKVGDNVLLFGLYATRGATFDSVTLDGRPFTAGSASERGHPVYTMTVPLPRGRTRTIVMHLREPASTAAPTVLRQPMVHPMQTTVRTDGCAR